MGLTADLPTRPNCPTQQLTLVLNVYETHITRRRWTQKEICTRSRPSKTILQLKDMNLTRTHFPYRLGTLTERNLVRHFRVSRPLRACNVEHGVRRKQVFTFACGVAVKVRLSGIVWLFERSPVELRFTIKSCILFCRVSSSYYTEFASRFKLPSTWVWRTKVIFLTLKATS